MEWMGTDNRAIAIVRVSSLRQSDDTSFRENQQKEIETYCLYNKMDLVKSFKFIESAKDSDYRQKALNAEAWADANNIRHRVYYMSDREARNLTDIERMEKRIRRDEIAIHHAQERKVYWEGASDSDFFMRDMQGVTNKHLSRVIRTKVVLAQKRKAESGWFPSNHCPLGYQSEALTDQNGRQLKRGKIVVPGPSRAVTQVRREFELRGNEHKTLREISDILASEGFLNKKQRKYSESTLQRRLTNTFYRGSFRWPNDGGPTYKGAHKLIIDPDLFDRVQETFGRGGVYTKKRGLLSGNWMSCADCGCAVVYDPKEVPLKSGGVSFHKYYRCSGGKRAHKPLRSIPEEKILDQLSKAIDSLTITDRFANQLSIAINEVQKKVQRKLRSEMSRYKEGLDDIIVKENRIMDQFAIGAIDKGLFDRQIDRARGKRQEFTDLLEKSNKLIADAGFETIQSTIELAKDAKSLWEKRSDIEKKAFIEKLVSNRVLDGVTVRYDLKKPFAELAKMKSVSDWRPQGNSNPRLRRERALS